MDGGTKIKISNIANIDRTKLRNVEGDPACTIVPSIQYGAPRARRARVLRTGGCSPSTGGARTAGSGAALGADPDFDGKSPGDVFDLVKEYGPPGPFLSKDAAEAF